MNAGRVRGNRGADGRVAGGGAARPRTKKTKVEEGTRC